MLSPVSPRFSALCIALFSFGALASCGGAEAEKPAASQALPPVQPGDLRPPEAFAGIADGTARSRAIFLEASRVMRHPRCVNCHPAGDSPHQRDEMALHDPPVKRGPDDKGVVGMECSSCHQEKNAQLARVPGAPKWHLAPKVMAWEGKSAADLCAQVKDPARNGGKSLQAIADHSAHDPLVGWGWTPGAGRTPAPGTQEKFGALIAAWIQTGAACPTTGGGAEEAKR
jgi:hypothetical protein